jgi:hypothetical protein
VSQGNESEELSDILTVQQTALLTVEDTIQSKGTKVTSHSRRFKSLVLRPRRIATEKNSEIHKSPYSHFETTAPSQGDLLNYTAIEGLDIAEVWLSLSDDQVE